MFMQNYRREQRDIVDWELNLSNQENYD